MIFVFTVWWLTSVASCLLITDDVFSVFKLEERKFEKHQNTNFHRKAVEFVLSLSGTKDVGQMLCTSHAELKTENREMLKVILSSIRYLGRQVLALCGHYKAECSSDRGQILREITSGILSW